MKVVLAIDGSESSLAAGKLVRRLAERQEMSLVALSAIQLPDVAMTFSTDVLYTGYIEDQERIAASNFARLAEVFQGSSVSPNHQIVRGHAGYEIVNYCADNKADLVVLGSKGHSTLDRVLLGSVSDYVATHAACSVLVARPSLAGRAENQGLKVSIAFDGSAPAEMAVEQFESFKWPFSVSVELLLAVPVYHLRQQGLSPVNIEIDSKKKAEAVAAEHQVLQRLRVHHAGATARIVEASHVGEALIGAARDAGSDLIMMGDTGRSAIARMLLGSTSRYVLRHAMQSVWIARKPKA